MYVPPAIAEDDPARLAALIAAHPLGLLISQGPGGLMANPVPFLWQDGLLRAHLARANPQVAELAAAPEVLVVFQPAEAYVTPGFYPSKVEHGRVVPTWNYAMVQAHGTARLDDSPDFLARQIAALTEAQERARPAPWAVSDAPAPFVEITVTAMRGKLKLSQNRPAPDRAGVRTGLMAEGDPLARLMPDDPAA